MCKCARVSIEIMRLTSHDHVTKPTAILSGKKCTIANECVYVCFVAMGKSCCAFGCTNRYKKGKNLSFYCFPVEPNRRARWTAAVNEKNWITGTRRFAAHTSSLEQKAMILYLLVMFLPSNFEVDTVRQLSHVHIHVERVIGVMY